VAVKMHVATSFKPGAEERAKELAFIQTMLDQAIDGTRSLANELAPPVLHDRSFGAALEWLAIWARERYSLHVQVEAEEAAEPGDVGMRNFLFENVRELLLNVVKHAQTDQVAIRLTRKGNMLHLQVKDQGRGF